MSMNDPEQDDDGMMELMALFDGTGSTNGTTTITPPPTYSYGYVGGCFLFDGKTYDPEKDFSRLKNNTIRVLLRILDGNKHGKPSLEPVGGSAYDSRIRDLRKARFGGFVIHEEADPTTNNTLSRYWLDMASVTDAKIRAILDWTIPNAASSTDTVTKGLRTAIRKQIKTMGEAECRSVLTHIGMLNNPSDDLLDD